MGVLYSKGEYLMNIDADDYLLDKNSVELLYNEAKKDNVDIIKFSVLTEYWGFNDCRNFNKIYYQPDIYDESFYNGYIIDLHITDKFIKNDLFKKAFNNFGNEIYGRNWNKHEDNIWNLLVRKNAISMKCMKNKIFAYQKHENSSLSLSQDQISDSMYSLFLADKLNEIINDENNKNVIQIYTNITKVLSIKILNSNTELKQKLINLGEKLLTQKNINEITKKKIKEIINCVNS